MVGLYPGFEEPEDQSPFPTGKGLERGLLRRRVLVVLPPLKLTSSLPRVGLEEFFEGRLGDACGVVRDRRGGNHEDDVEHECLIEASLGERSDVVIVNLAALFDQRPWGPAGAGVRGSPARRPRSGLP
jgi:hypothetical protein